MDGHIMRCGTIGSCQSAATFRDCKALLVTSLTRVSGAIASVQTFTFTLTSPVPYGLTPITVRTMWCLFVVWQILVRRSAWVSSTNGERRTKRSQLRRHRVRRCDRQTGPVLPSTWSASRCRPCRQPAHSHPARVQQLARRFRQTWPNFGPINGAGIKLGWVRGGIQPPNLDKSTFCRAQLCYITFILPHMEA